MRRVTSKCANSCEEKVTFCFSNMLCVNLIRNIDNNDDDLGVFAGLIVKSTLKNKFA